LTSRNATLQRPKLDSGEQFQAVATIEAALPLGSDNIPHGQRSSSRRNEHILDDQPDMQSFPAHHPIHPNTSHDPDNERIEHVVSIQAAVIPGDPTPPGFWDDLADSWGHDPNFFPLSDEKHQAHTQFDSASNPAPQHLGALSSDNDFILDFSSPNHRSGSFGSKSHLYHDRPLPQTDGQDVPHAQGTVQLGPWDNNYSLDLTPDPEATISTSLFHNGVLGYVQPSSSFNPSSCLHGSSASSHRRKL